MRFILSALFIVLYSCGLLGVEPIRISLATQEHFVDFRLIMDLQEFIEKALKDENILVTFVPVPIYRGTKLADTGELDGEMARDKESLVGFNNIITSTHPLAIVQVKVVYLRGNKKYARTKLKELRCGTLLNNKGTEKKLEDDHIKCLTFKDSPQAFKLLEAGRIDYFLLSEPVVEAFFEKNPGSQKTFVMDDSAYTDMQLYVVFNKKHAALMPVIEKALKSAIKSDLPKYQRLQRDINRNF